jgi:HD-like signal output (HDOD) protein
MKAAPAPTPIENLRKRMEGLRQIPTIPAVLAPLIRYIQQPVEQLDVQKITDMIAQDKSLAAQCLEMANSPLFGRWQKVETLRAAVIGLGFQRVGDIAMSCGVLNLLPRDGRGIDPVAFWEHSLGCALVSRHLARMISFPDPGKAYLAGLLHDIGVIVNLWVLPKEFQEAFQIGRQESIPLHEAERRVMGFDHCESGRFLAEKWGLPADLIQVVAFHHTPVQSSDQTGLVALIELSDLLCRMSGLNHGYVEARQVDVQEEPGFAILAEKCALLKQFDWARLTFELDSYMDDVHALVRTIYRK